MRRIFISLLVLSMLPACIPQRDYIYFYKKNKAIQEDSLHKDVATQSMPEHIIRPGDILEIMVSSDISLDINSIQNKENSSNITPIGYIVTSTGHINISLIGQVKVINLTAQTLQDTLYARLKKYYVAPFVKASVQGFNVTVIGEVKLPGVQKVAGDQITVLQALAMAGDLGIDGKRTELKVIREVDGKIKMIGIDLSSATIFNSEGYYLQSNDIVVVSPFKYKRYSTKIQQVSYVSNILGALLFALALFIR